MDLTQQLTTIENAAQEGSFGCNSRPVPTDAQCHAGNYKVGKIDIYGLPISIEQPRNSYRTGIDANGKRWTARLAAHYGYIRGTLGKDGDPVDCFIGVFPDAEMVYVINQIVNGKFDEHKVMLCFLNQEDAETAYRQSYDRHWNGLGSIVPATIEQFKWWLKYGNLHRPLHPDYLPYPGLETMNKIKWSTSHLPTEFNLDQVLYQIRQADPNNPLLLDAVTMDAVLEGADEIITFDALVTPYAQLERKMTVLKAVMERAGTAIKPVAMQISNPFKQNNVAQVAVIFELSDGQTVTIFMHNPDVTPKKIAPTDELISWKWLLNKKDITIVVAPERGQDLNVRNVAQRIMKLAEKNSPAFARANVKRAERMEQIQDLRDEITVLEKELVAAQSDLEAAKLEYEERKENRNVDPVTDSPLPIHSFKGDTLESFVTPNKDGIRFNVSSKDIESDIFLPEVKILNNEDDAISYAKKIANIEPEPTDPADEQTNQQTETTTETEAAGTEKKLKAVDLAYQFQNATDEFKEWLFESIGKSEYSPFATAVAMDKDAIANNAIIHWGFSVSQSDIPDLDGSSWVGEIMKSGIVVGRVDFGNDGKAMVYVGSEGSQRVKFASGVEAMYSDDDAPLMVSALFAMVNQAGGTNTEDPEKSYIDTLQAIVDGQHDADNLDTLLDLIDQSAQALADAGKAEEYDALIGAAAEKWASLDEKANG